MPPRPARGFGTLLTSCRGWAFPRPGCRLPGLPRVSVRSSQGKRSLRNTWGHNTHFTHTTHRQGQEAPAARGACAPQGALGPFIIVIFTQFRHEVASPPARKRKEPGAEHGSGRAGMSLQTGMDGATGLPQLTPRSSNPPPLGARLSPSKLLTRHMISQQPPEHPQASEGKDPAVAPMPGWPPGSCRHRANTVLRREPLQTPPSPHVGDGGTQSCGRHRNPQIHLHGEVDAPPWSSVGPWGISGSPASHRPSGLSQGWIFRDCKEQGMSSCVPSQRESSMETRSRTKCQQPPQDPTTRSRTRPAPEPSQAKLQRGHGREWPGPAERLQLIDALSN